MEIINNYGNLFSLLGLSLTLLTFISVIFNKRVLNTLNKKNFKINRMPENLEDLKEISNNLSDLLTDFDNKKKNIKVELSKIQPILKSLTKSLNNDEMDNLTTLKKSTKNIDNWTYEGEEISFLKSIISKQKEMTENMVNEIDIKLTRLITDISNIGRDQSKNVL